MYLVSDNIKVNMHGMRPKLMSGDGSHDEISMLLL
jgi:hypothetical protein